MITNTRYGDMDIVSEHDLISRSLLEYGEWAQLEINSMLHFINPSDTVLDVGAYIGTHSRAFSERVGAQGRVVSFEACGKNACFLKRNAELAEIKNIEVKVKGLSDREKNYYAHNDSELKNGGGNQLSDTVSGAPVEVVTIDSLGIKNVSFIKIDVEGMEYEVIRGGEETIKRDVPGIFVEVNSLKTALPVFYWAMRGSYRVFGVSERAYNPFNYKNCKDNFFDDASECGFLLLDPTREIPDSTLNMEVKSEDDVALLLLNKKQYPYEVLVHSSLGKTLGVNYHSPYAGQLLERLKKLRKELEEIGK